MCRIQRAIVTAVLLATAAVWMGGCENATVLRKQGLAAYERGDYATTQTKFAKLAKDNPADWEAQWYLGRAALAQGNIDEAQTHLEVAYTLRDKGEPLNPETEDIVDDLATAILLSGDRARCISLCDEAIRNFGNVRDYLRKGDMLMKMGDADAAVVAYLQAGKIGNYENVEPYIRLADLYTQAGARQKAIDTLRVADYIAPKDDRVTSRIRALGEIPGPTFAVPPTP